MAGDASCLQSNSIFYRSQVSLRSALAAVGEAEEEGLLGDGGGQVVEGGHLGVGEGCEVSGDVDVFFELGDVVAADDDGTDRVREGEAHRVLHGHDAGAVGDGGAFP
jgi:hypothetical protein